jgi:glycosyltransferase involved in cell wall biosynthesis
VVDQFPEFLGGGERNVLEVARLLPQYGYRVSILTFAVHSKSVATKESPCPLYLLPLVRTYDLQALRAAFALRKFVHKENVKIVQTYFESSDIWAGLVTRSLSRAALIWNRRDLGILRDGKHHMAYRWMRRMPNAVFAVSEQVRQYTIDVDGVPADRVKTVYNGLNLSKLSAGLKESEQDLLRVGTVGNIRFVKGHDIFIDAVALIAKKFPSTMFEIAGGVLEAEYYSRLQAAIAAEGLTGRIVFRGPVVDVATYLKTLDIFVLPSRSEGFSNAIIEAMAASLPVVATDVGGNAEAVEDGVTGWIVEPNNAERLAAALTLLLGNPDQAKAMGRAGRTRVEENFTTEAMMRRITSVYSSLA